MARYIDADAFVKEINERIDAAIKWGCNAIADGNSEIKIRAEQAVATFCEASLTAKKIQTADAVEVVRCKDCKWATDEEPGIVYCPNIVGGWCGDDWFCKSGERREE